MNPGLLEKIRLKTGLSQKDFPKALGLKSRSSVTMFESGLRKPSGPIKMLYRYISKFGPLKDK